MADKNFEDLTILASLQIIPGEIGTLLVSLDGINMTDLPPQFVDLEMGNLDAEMSDLITKLEIAYAEHLVSKASKKSKKKTNKKRRPAASSKKPTAVKESTAVFEEKDKKLDANEAGQDDAVKNESSEENPPRPIEAVISKEDADTVDGAAEVIETEEGTEGPEDLEVADAEDKETTADISSEVNTLFDMDY